MAYVYYEDEPGPSGNSLITLPISCSRSLVCRPKTRYFVVQIQLALVGRLFAHFFAHFAGCIVQRVERSSDLCRPSRNFPVLRGAAQMRRTARRCCYRFVIREQPTPTHLPILSASSQGTNLREKYPKGCDDYAYGQPLWAENTDRGRLRVVLGRAKSS